MRQPPSSPLPRRDRLERTAGEEPERRRFLGAALASAVVLALPGCAAPTFDPNTTTLTFRRRTSGGSGRRN